ncbi:MAG: ParB N-terminal domain-containing protein, partial [Candidatus Saccharicenans sp.]
MEVKVVKLKEIDLKDRRFRFTFSRPEEKFLRSVKEIGIIEPVVVVARQGRKVLISGWKRAEAALIFGLKELPAMEI